MTQPTPEPVVGKHVLLTGPIIGDVTIEHDGQEITYNVSPFAIVVDEDHRQVVADAIAERYATEGHPLHMYTGVPFKHVKGGSKAAEKLIKEGKA